MSIDKREVPAGDMRERERAAVSYVPLPRVWQSPLLLLFSLVLSVFLTEALVMGLLRYLPGLSPAIEAVVDAVLLIVLNLPVLYLLLFRPMTAHIQEHQRIEDALRENEEEQYRIMVHHSLDGFWVADTRGRFLEVNDAYCQMMGYSRDELLSMCISDVEAMESPEETARHIQGTSKNPTFIPQS